MQIHRWQRRLALPQPVALTIGNFDGVHRGHQAILQTLLAEAAREDLAPVLLSFSRIRRRWCQASRRRF